MARRTGSKLMRGLDPRTTDPSRIPETIVKHHVHRIGLAALLLGTCQVGAQTAPTEPSLASLEGTTLYRVLTLRAAPGEFDAWLEAIPRIRSAYAARGDHPPFVLRHSQGDQWDFMLIEPWGDFAGYVADARMRQRTAAAESMAFLRSWLDDAPAFREDLFALGPEIERLERLFDENGLYHVEMFHALPRKKTELLAQRRMENDYLRRTGQTANTIWSSVGGSDVDVFTIGFHTDLEAFAAGSPMTPTEKDQAARAVGFESVGAISGFLRGLLARHHDTLAVAVD